MLDEELGLFFPEEAMRDLKGFKDDFVSYPRQFRQPIIPTYYNEHQKYQAEQEEWTKDRMAVVVDNEHLRHVKYFEVSAFDLSRYAFRRHLEAGDSLTEDQIEFATEFNSDEEDVKDGEGNKIRKKVRNCQDDGKEDYNPHWGAQYAAWFLGRPTAKWCRLRGIRATRIASSDVSAAVVNLQQANRDFEEFEEAMWGTEGWSPLPKASTSLADKVEELAL